MMEAEPFFFMPTLQHESRLASGQLDGHLRCKGTFLPAYCQDKPFYKNKDQFSTSKQLLTQWSQGMVHSSFYSQEEKVAIVNYASNSYEVLWEWCELHEGEEKDDGYGSQGWIKHFFEALDKSEPLPSGIVLFEGQGKHEDDVYPLLAGLIPGSVITRRRPTSTTWHPNVGLLFSTDNNASNDSKGCLIVHVIDKENVQAIYTESVAPFSQECEITLQDGIEMEVVSIERNVAMPSKIRALNRVAVETRYPSTRTIVYVKTRAMCQVGSKRKTFTPSYARDDEREEPEEESCSLSKRMKAAE
jgi:hypothetical protein